MPYVVDGAKVGRDNRAVGSVAGGENLVAGTFSPKPLRPMETGAYGAAVSVTSITRSSDVGTVSATGHGVARGQRFRIIGAEQAEYNREFVADTVADANTITFTVYGSPTSPATGTITLRLIRGGVGD